MEGLPRPPPNAAVLVGTETGDDAGVYRLDEERALVVTADFITPVCDDAFRFGEVAAANALSDVYAMGGRPLVALAICSFPKGMPGELGTAILAGGQQKAAEAGAAIVGGHTVCNPELFYGLSVTGTVDPRRVVRNVGARPGDALVLSKPLGTGLIINGRRKGLGSDEDLAAALASMAMLNRAAAEAALAAGARAMTDITGFGLVGHAVKMALGSGVRLVFDAGALPVLDGAEALAAQGVTTGSTRGNREAGVGHLESDGPLPPVLDQILHDPQTSGGMLVAVPGDRADALVDAMRAAGATRAARIGEVLATGPAGLQVRGDLARYRR
jgi:selenide,water dikinase